MKQIHILSSILLLLVLMQGIQNYHIYNINVEMKNQLKRNMDEIINYKLYDPNNKKKVILNGVFFEQGYYCVKTEGRKWEDIKMTDYHEMCHAFISMDKDHFCNKKNQTNWDIENYFKKN